MGWLRHPKTTQERRINCHRGGGWARAKRNFRNLPQAYDDINRTVQRSWKEHRDTQYHLVDMNDEPSQRKRRRDRPRPLGFLMEVRHATAEKADGSQVGPPEILQEATNDPGEEERSGRLGEGEAELPQPPEPLGRLPEAPGPLLEELPPDPVQD